MPLRLLLIPMLWASLVALSLAQTTYQGQVLSAETGEPVAFARIQLVGSQRGTLSDVDGRFRLSDNPRDTLRITSIGYKTLSLVRPSASAPLSVRLVPDDVKLGDVVISAYDSVAIRIMRRAIANREANDPERQPGFSYRSYNRMGIVLLERKKISEPFKPDSAVPVIPLESVTERRFGGGSRNLETVEGAQLIGLPGLSFGMISSSLQDFSFYRDRVQLLGQAFLSPLHTRATSLYWFSLKDSVQNEDGSTTYTIEYSPRAKGEMAFSGFLKLRTPHYALEIVQADLRPVVNAVGIEQGKIQQLYQPVGTEGRWFPAQYLLDIRLFPQSTPPTQRVQIIGRSYIQDVKLGVPDMPRRISSAVVIDGKAADRDSAYWNQARPFALTQDEARVAKLLDSANRKVPFLGAMLRQTEFLVQQEIAIGKVSIDLPRTFQFYNRVEGLRLGLALTTNTRFSEYWRFSGNAAFGMLDDRWKYGGEIRYMPQGERDSYLGLGYQYDLYETGGQRLRVNPQRPLYLGDGNDPLRGYFLNRMDYRQRLYAETGWAPATSISLRLIGRYDQIETQRGFRADLPGITRVGEAELTLRWAPGETSVRKSGVPFVTKIGRPVLLLRGTRGFQPEDGKGQAWDYYKAEAALSTVADLHKWGALLINGSAHLLDRPAPYANGFTLPGMLLSNTSQQGFETGYAFGTLPVQTFGASRMASGSLTYRLPIRIGKPTSLIQPVFYAVHRSAWGKLDNWAVQEAQIRGQRDFQQGVHESGLLVAGLLDRMPGINFPVAIGVLWRHGPIRDPKAANNIYFTLGITQRF